jgi:hypothetical protein
MKPNIKSPIIKCTIEREYPYKGTPSLWYGFKLEDILLSFSKEFIAVYPTRIAITSNSKFTVSYAVNSGRKWVFYESLKYELL